MRLSKPKHSASKLRRDSTRQRLFGASRDSKGVGKKNRLENLGFEKEDIDQLLSSPDGIKAETDLAPISRQSLVPRKVVEALLEAKNSVLTWKVLMGNMANMCGGMLGP